ncbi:hypothetical protein CRYUN_Cryun08bG0115500 [Craigia yunnanensis]
MLKAKKARIPESIPVLTSFKLLMVTGGSLEESKEALAIAETDGRLFCTVGVHPTRCKEFEESGILKNIFKLFWHWLKREFKKGSFPCMYIGFLFAEIYFYNNVVAIGECGLDYDRLHFCPPEIQKRYFEKQIELAYGTKLPMFLHMRAAAEDFCEIMEQNIKKLDFWICPTQMTIFSFLSLLTLFTGGVIHLPVVLKTVISFSHSITCILADSLEHLHFFTQSNKLMEMIFAMYLFEAMHCYGYTEVPGKPNESSSFCSITGVNGCSLKMAENLDVVRDTPVERMMIETDSPYCEIKSTHAGINFVKSLWPYKKKEKYDQESLVKGRNEPCLVRQVLELVAGCKGISDIDQLSVTLYQNTCRVFFPHDLDAAADALLAGRHESQ